MIAVLIILWLLTGLFAGLIVRHHDGSISLLQLLLFILTGTVALIVVGVMVLGDIEI